MLTPIKAGVAVLISENVDFRAKNNTMDKKGHFVTIKGPIHPEDITILNVSNRSSKNFK